MKAPALGVLTLVSVMLMSCSTLQSSKGSEKWKYGLANHGLRLGLHIGPSWDEIHLRLKNETDKPVTLLTNWTYERQNAGYQVYVGDAVKFFFTPELWEIGGQTLGKFRTSPQQRYTLEPGAFLTWKDEKSVVGHESNWRFEGLYKVQAMLAVHTTEWQLQLVSNAESMKVGNEDKPPKHNIACTIAVRKRKNRLSVNLGSEHGVAFGDIFKLGSMGPCWQMTVDRVYDNHASGPFKQIRGRKGVPKVGDWARIIFEPEESMLNLPANEVDW